MLVVVVVAVVVMFGNDCPVSQTILAQDVLGCVRDSLLLRTNVKHFKS